MAPQVACLGGRDASSASALPDFYRDSQQSPSPAAKTDRELNGTSGRQHGLTEGSVSHQVNQKHAQREQHSMPDDSLDKAVMHSRDGIAKMQPTSRKRQQKSLQRLLSSKDALIADLLHCQLARNGLADLDELCSIVGLQPRGRLDKKSELSGQVVEHLRVAGSTNSSSASSSRAASYDSDSESDSDSEPGAEVPEQCVLNEKALQTLLTFLRLADGIEEKLREASGECSALPLAAPEKLLQQLLIQLGPAALLRSRVQATLSATCFPREADNLEQVLRRNIKAANRVLDSQSLAILLEGVLHSENFANSSSNRVESASGVTLHSLLQLGQRPGETLPDTQESETFTNAFSLLVKQLQSTQEPEWFSSLMSDLQICQEACDLQSNVGSLDVQELTAHFSAIEKCFESADDSPSSEASSASIPAHLQHFMAYAPSRLAMLRALDQDLCSAADALRERFSEPPTTSLHSLLQSLASLLDLLPEAEGVP